jgi:hypothetical protein
MPVKLTVDRIEPSSITSVLEKEIYDEELEGYGGTIFSKTISEVWLDEGDYRIRVESLQDVPELADVPVHFAVQIPGNWK